MYKLKEKTKEMAAFTLGTRVEEFIDFDFDEEIQYINNRSESKCVFVPEEDDRIFGRGNPLLARGEFLTMEEVDKELSGE